MKDFDWLQVKINNSFKNSSSRAQNRYKAEASLVGKKCARMSADFRCGRHVESNQTRGNFIGVNMAEYEIEPLKVL
jgi:hypothetical protein